MSLRQDDGPENVKDLTKHVCRARLSMSSWIWMRVGARPDMPEARPDMIRRVGHVASDAGAAAVLRDGGTPW